MALQWDGHDAWMRLLWRAMGLPWFEGAAMKLPWDIMALTED